uniref:XRE family transcriptional regulator n=1 Tax=Desulfobacca acetoxidans TaxID=60893 RepID=A0A7V4G6B5_9BACT
MSTRRPPRRRRPPAHRTLDLKRLRAYRQQRGLTLARVQELTGISRSALCDFEQGRTVLQLHKLLALIRLYDLDLFELAALFRLEVLSPGHLRLFRHACAQTGCSAQEALEDLIVRYYMENSTMAHHLDK